MFDYVRGVEGRTSETEIRPVSSVFELASERRVSVEPGGCRRRRLVAI
jgi:hypothetical protein